jgi:putative hemolysin
MPPSEPRGSPGSVTECDASAPDERRNKDIGTDGSWIERAFDDMLALRGRKPSRGVALVRRLLSFDRLDEALATIKATKRTERLAAIAEAFNINYVFNGLENLRDVGDRAAIVFGNHPIGSGNVVGMCILLDRCFSDHRIIGHRYMKFIPSLADKMIPVDPFRSASSINLEALVKLRREFGTEYQALGLFPAGNSSELKMSGGISDRRWSDAFIRIARHHDAVLVPVWFSGRNRLRYYLASKIRAELGFLALPSEFLRLSGKTITVNIGKPISPNVLKSIPDREARLSFLRASVYELERARVMPVATRANGNSRALGVTIKRGCAIDPMSIGEGLELRFFHGAEAKGIEELAGTIADDALTDISMHVVLTPRGRLVPFVRWQMLNWGQFTARDLERLSPIRRAFRLPSDVARSASSSVEIVAFGAGDQAMRLPTLGQIRKGLRQSATVSGRSIQLIGLVPSQEDSLVLAGLQFSLLQKAHGDSALLRFRAERDVIGATHHHGWRVHRDAFSCDTLLARRQIRQVDPLLRALTAIGVKFGAAGLSADTSRPCILGSLACTSDL